MKPGRRMICHEEDERKQGKGHNRPSKREGKIRGVEKSNPKTKKDRGTLKRQVGIRPIVAGPPPVRRRFLGDDSKVKRITSTTVLGKSGYIIHRKPLYGDVIRASLKDADSQGFRKKGNRPAAERIRGGDELHATPNQTVSLLDTSADRGQNVFIETDSKTGRNWEGHSSQQQQCVEVTRASEGLERDAAALAQRSRATGSGRTDQGGTFQSEKRRISTEVA